MNRVSRIGEIKVITLLFSAVCHVGDSMKISPNSNVLAVQRELPHFVGIEGTLQEISIFQQPFPRLNITERVQVSMVHDSPFVDVERVEILGLSTAAVFQAGNTHAVEAENRTKHIRHLMPRPDYQSGGS